MNLSEVTKKVCSVCDHIDPQEVSKHLSEDGVHRYDLEDEKIALNHAERLNQIEGVTAEIEITDDPQILLGGDDFGAVDVQQLKHFMITVTIDLTSEY